MFFYRSLRDTHFTHLKVLLGEMIKQCHIHAIPYFVVATLGYVPVIRQVHTIKSRYWLKRERYPNLNKIDIKSAWYYLGRIFSEHYSLHFNAIDNRKLNLFSQSWDLSSNVTSSSEHHHKGHRQLWGLFSRIPFWIASKFFLSGVFDNLKKEISQKD